LPRREHVVFFDNPEAALKAGYRACKRCQPDGPSLTEERSSRIARACRLLEEPDQDLSLATVARRVGMSLFHFHRLFKAETGVTPKQYRQAHQLKRFRTELRRRSSVTEALYEAGYPSSGRAYDQVRGKLGMSPGEYRQGGQGVNLVYAVEPTALGWMLVAATDRGVCALELGADPTSLERRLAALFPKANRQKASESLQGFTSQVLNYLKSPLQGLSLMLDLQGTPFQQRVWAALQAVPPGQTITYRQLAAQIGRPEAIRAVASACASNRVALAVPCHRAVRTDGGLGGYRWGLARKRALLQGEKQKSNKAGG
jgi:AraC family transcriptional regulator of adaptative response/methylated-DNA-[protein]-cysteine methyltransferase